MVPRVSQAASLLLAGLVLGGCADRDPVAQNPAANHPPQISSLSILPDSICPGCPATLRCVAGDADQDSLRYSWTLDGGSVTGAAPTFTWTAPNAAGPLWLRVTVSDGREEVRDSLRATVLGGTLLIQTGLGTVAARLDGSHGLLTTDAGETEVLGQRIFFGGGRTIVERNSTMEIVRTVEVSDSAQGYFTVLPDGGFAFCSNRTDKICFLDPDGGYIRTVPLPVMSPDELQGIDGLTVGNTLYISETGEHQIVAVDLSTYEASIYKSIEDDDGWLGGLGYRKGVFYLTRWDRITRFTHAGAPETLCSFPDGNAIKIAIVAGYGFVTINFTGEVYRVDLASGQYQLFLSGLNYPQDIEYVPAEVSWGPDR